MKAYEAFNRSLKAARQLDTEKIGNDGLLIGQVRARVNELNITD